jgi:hypothetical protein
MLKIKALCRICERDRTFAYRVDGGEKEDEEGNLPQEKLSISPHRFPVDTYHADVCLRIVGNEKTETRTWMNKRWSEWLPLSNWENSYQGEQDTWQGKSRGVGSFCRLEQGHISIPAALPDIVTNRCRL